jgi:hypothetical protein
MKREREKREERMENTRFDFIARIEINLLLSRGICGPENVSTSWK